MLYLDFFALSERLKKQIEQFNIAVSDTQERLTDIDTMLQYIEKDIMTIEKLIETDNKDQIKECLQRIQIRLNQYREKCQ